MATRHHRQNGPRWTGAAAVGLAATLLAGVARADDAAALADLKKQYDEIRAGHVLTGDEAAKLGDQLSAWSFSPAALSSEQRGWLFHVQIAAALGAGDARSALRTLVELEGAAAESPETLEATVTAASAAGDAARAEEALKKLRPKLGETEQKGITPRLRWLKRVGTRAPELEARSDSGVTIALARREGALLVVDLWSVRSKPDARYVQALTGLYDAYKTQLTVEFLGVNTDSAARVDAARAFAQESGYAWPQVYEQRVTDAPITHRGFAAGLPPWTILIDGDGYIRAIGDAREPAFQYALRAAVAETNGKFPPLAPRTVDGRVLAPRKPEKPKPKDEPPASPPPSGPAPQAGGEDHPPAPPPKGGELPSNPEAAEMIKKARLFLKTGKRGDAKKLLQDVVARFPGTREAKEAEFLLTNL